MIIGSASIVSYILTIEGLGDAVRQLALPLAHEPVLFLMVVMISLLLVGTILDPAAAIALLVPVLAPVALVLGIDPLHFAMVVILSLTLGLVTPPVGICLSYLPWPVMVHQIPKYMAHRLAAKGTTAKLATSGRLSVRKCRIGNG